MSGSLFFVLFCKLSYHILLHFKKLGLLYFLIHFQFFKKLALFPPKYTIEPDSCLFPRSDEIGSVRGGL